jgi:hypothetical protein
MAKKRVLLEETTVYEHLVARRVGTIGWDSNSGRVWGTLGEQIRTAGEEAKGRGFVEVPGPNPSIISIRIRDPFHAPKEFAQSSDPWVSTCLRRSNASSGLRSTTRSRNPTRSDSGKTALRLVTSVYAAGGFQA